MARRFLALGFVGWFFLAAAATAADRAPHGPADLVAAAGTDVGSGKAAGDPEASGKQPRLEELPDGRLRLQNLLLDREAANLEIPGRVNMDRGMIEVLACAPWGKTHESLFVLETEPYLVQIGLLLLLGMPPGSVGQVDPGQSLSDYVPDGPPLKIEASWSDSLGTEHSAPVESLICRAGGDGMMEPGQWVFTGSILEGKVFQAQNVGTVVATYVDPTAIVNNARKDAQDDEAYEICSDRVPPKGTPVRLILTAGE